MEEGRNYEWRRRENKERTRKGMQHRRKTDKKKGKKEEEWRTEGTGIEKERKEMTEDKVKCREMK